MNGWLDGRSKCREARGLQPESGGIKPNDVPRSYGGAQNISKPIR